MARSRNIKPGIFKNELLGVADPMLTILFQSLWCLADKAGRLEDRPLRIKAETFPYREGLDVNGYLTELERMGFIHRYCVGDISLIQVVNFDKHQNPHKTEKESELPDYSMKTDSCSITVKAPLKNGTSRADSLIPDSLIPDTGLPSECAEQEICSTPPYIEIPLIGDNLFPISMEQVDEWISAYPAVDVPRQLVSMRQWCFANPKRRKTKRGVLSFCNSWLMREQDKGRPANFSQKEPKFDPTAYVNRNRNKPDDNIIDIN